jgi:hypothetical protein
LMPGDGPAHHNPSLLGTRQRLPEISLLAKGRPVHTYILRVVVTLRYMARKEPCDAFVSVY